MRGDFLWRQRDRVPKEHRRGYGCLLFLGMEDGQRNPGSCGGRGSPSWFFSCFSSFRKEERVSCHQSQEKDTLPSMAWPRAHCHITSNYPKPFPSPSPFPPTADSSFPPSSTPQSPHSPESSPGSSVTPPPFSCAPLGSRPPRIKNPLPPPLQVSGVGKVFPVAQLPSQHTHRPLSLPSPQAAPEIHPTIKRNRGPPTSKILDSSLSYRPASSTPFSRVPSPMWL